MAANLKLYELIWGRHGQGKGIMIEVSGLKHWIILCIVYPTDRHSARHNWILQPICAWGSTLGLCICNTKYHHGPCWLKWRLLSTSIYLHNKGVTWHKGQLEYNLSGHWLTSTGLLNWNNRKYDTIFSGSDANATKQDTKKKIWNKHTVQLHTSIEHV